MKRFVFVPNRGDPIEARALNDLRLEQMQGLVGGYMEQVPCVYKGEKKQMFVNELGLLLKLPTNTFASIMAQRRIVGNAFIALDKVEANVKI